MPKTPRSAREAAPVVQLSGLRKSYGTTLAVDGLDLTIASGEVVALLGPNGAGKSTTVDMLLGLIRPDAGTANLFGGSPRSASSAGRVGAMLQNGGLLPGLTVGELVDMMCHLYPDPQPVDTVLTRAGITDIADRRTDALSGGQAQRVRFALALAPDPDLLVLDEPTAAMDVESRRAFWASTRTWAAGGGTVVFATHYLEEADAFADRIVLLRRGSVIADGPTGEIKAMAGGRTIRATIPSDAAHRDARTGLDQLPGVAAVEFHGDTVVLACPDSDTALRALLAACPGARDIEVSGAGLEEAFLALTGTSAPADGSSDNTPDRITDSPAERTADRSEKELSR
jgi:ABC-2 type transport system ATP-binding protein